MNQSCINPSNHRLWPTRSVWHCLICRDPALHLYFTLFLWRFWASVKVVDVESHSQVVKFRCCVLLAHQPNALLFDDLEIRRNKKLGILFTNRDQQILHSVHLKSLNSHKSILSLALHWCLVLFDQAFLYTLFSGFWRHRYS